MFLIFLCGCTGGRVKVYSDEEIGAFDELLEKTNVEAKRYDLRHEDDCRLGRIPGFFCVRNVNSKGEEKTLDQIYEDLTLILRKKSTPIILMDYDGSDASYLAEKLKAAGYSNVHYFGSGYERYASLEGETFVPETGDCDSCSA
ncbi:MAG TPA: rhodanese-like domain-containing protein [Bacilli bacterium]